MKPRNPDYIVDIKQLQGSVGRYQPVTLAEPNPRDLRHRPWLAVHWKCCHVYSRVYRNAEGTLYEGACPRCGRRARARVAADGIDARFFEAQ